MASPFLRFEPANPRQIGGKYVPHQNTRERARRLKQLGHRMRDVYDRASSGGTGTPDVLVDGDGVYITEDDGSVTFHPHSDVHV